jgi:signal peptidase II
VRLASCGLDPESLAARFHTVYTARMNRSTWQHWFNGPFTRLGLWAALITFLLDQSHKWWMLLFYRIQDKGRVRVSPFLDLVFVLNQGVSYGMFQSGRTGQWLLAGFAVLASLGLTVWLATNTENKVVAVGLGMIIGGAIGNGLDRITLGGVADFFSLHAYGYYWYVFNIADIAIVAGVACLVYDLVIANRSSAAKTPQ